MAEFNAFRYSVGGSWTHGGDRELHVDPQPDGLAQVWAADGCEWRESYDDLGMFWYPVENGVPVADGDQLEWWELVDQHGPIFDRAPVAARELVGAWS